MFTVIGVIDKVERDDSRPDRVEKRHSKAYNEKVGDDCEPVTVETMQPRESGVIAPRFLGIVAGVPNRGLVDASKDDDRPDIIRVEGLLSTPSTGTD